MGFLLKVFSFTLMMGTVIAGGYPPRHFHRYRGGYSVYSSPVITRSSPIYVSKSVSPIVSYPPPAISYSGPSVSYVKSGPPTYISSAPETYIKGVPAAYLGSGPAYISSAHGHPAYISSAPAYVSSAPVHAHGHAAYVSSAPVHSHGHAAVLSSAPAHGHAHAAYVSAVPAHGHVDAAYVSEVPAAPVALLSTAGKPKVYSHSIPAAAIKNIETVMVTKTITPVITKTTTHQTDAHPAVSVGHVQGYSHGAVGHAKIAPVSFDTQYTAYSPATVGLSGPVVYSQPQTVAVAAQPVLKTVAAAPVQKAVYKTISQPFLYKTSAPSVSVVDTFELGPHSSHGSPAVLTSGGYVHKK